MFNRPTRSMEDGREGREEERAGEGEGAERAEKS